MKRWLAGIICTVSLLLCATAVVFWVRSYWHWDDIMVMNSENDGIQVHSFPGLLSIAVIWTTKAPPTQPGVEFTHHYGAFHGVLPWVRWGFGIKYNRIDQQASGYPGAAISDRYELILPIWFVVVATLLAPIPPIKRAMRHRRRVARGLCLFCGYDLRASTDRCPECGMAIPAPNGGMKQGHS